MMIAAVFSQDNKVAPWLEAGRDGQGTVAVHMAYGIVGPKPQSLPKICNIR